MRRCPRNARSAATPCRHVGQGTERVEETLAKLFPDVPIARLDRDVVRKRGDLESVVSRIASGEARILVGTQMVTKGHDFPNVTLVVVLNADQGLFSTDFRAPERVAQTIIQVAGRAGRGTKPGEVLIQTEYPGASAAAKPAQGGLRRICARRARRTRGGGLAAVRARGGAARLGHGAGAGSRVPARRRAQLAGRVAGPQVAGAGARRDDASARRVITPSCCIEARERAPLHRAARRLAAARGSAQDAARSALVARRGSARAVLAACYVGGIPAGRVARCFSRLGVERRAVHRASMARSIAGGKAELACCIPPSGASDESVAGICHSEPTRQARPAVRAARSTKLRQ